MRKMYTWSRKSSLNTNDWNPYPELERGRENPAHNSKEGYKTYPWVRPTNYNDLSKTWNVQKPYNL